jgi:hypothetical protein
MLLITLLLITILALTVPAMAQQATPAIPATGTPEAMPVLADDPRLSLCSAPTLEGFAPYIIRLDDQLADLLTGAPNISVTQLAALNCLDDPQSLPVGAVIWIPASAMPEAPTSAESAAPAMHDLNVESAHFENQDTFTITWDATGDAVYFYQCPASDGDCPRPALAKPVAPAGELLVGGYRYAGIKRYRLEVEGSGETISQDLTFEVTCSQTWLGPFSGFASCPAEPAQAVFAAWQPFEGGVMLWFSDTSEIWVLTNVDQRVQIFADTYVEGDPNSDASAPDDRHTPERGFGKVWESLGGPDSALGWALSSETGFDSARQSAGSRSYTTYIQGPGTTVYAVTLIPQIEVGLWTQVAG